MGKDLEHIHTHTHTHTHTHGLLTYEEWLKSISNQELKLKYKKTSFHVHQIDKVKESGQSRCWKGSRTPEKLIHCVNQNICFGKQFNII